MACQRQRRVGDQHEGGRLLALLLLPGSLLLSTSLGGMAHAQNRSPAGEEAPDGAATQVPAANPDRGREQRGEQKAALSGLYAKATHLAQENRYDEAIVAFAALDRTATMMRDRLLPWVVAQTAKIKDFDPSQWYRFADYLKMLAQDTESAARALENFNVIALWETQSQSDIDLATSIATHSPPDSLPGALRLLDDADALARQMVMRSEAAADTFFATAAYVKAFQFRQEQAMQRLSSVGRLRAYFQHVAAIGERNDLVDSLHSQARAACLERDYAKADTLLAQGVIEINSLLADSLVRADSAATAGLQEALREDVTSLEGLREEKHRLSDIAMAARMDARVKTTVFDSSEIARLAQRPAPAAGDLGARLDALRAMRARAELLSKSDIEAATRLWRNVYAEAGSLSNTPEARANPFLGREPANISQVAMTHIVLGISEQETRREIHTIFYCASLADSLAEGDRPADGAKADSLYGLALQNIDRLLERRTLDESSQGVLRRFGRQTGDSREVYAAVRRLQDLRRKKDQARANALVDSLLNREGIENWGSLQLQLLDQKAR